MGRKIPGRKHRGVKDPEKQRQQRLLGIKDKINAPPTNPDEQQISKSLSKIIELKNNVRNGLYNKKRKKEKHENKEKKFKGKPEKPTPEFKQYPGESDRAFMNRVNRICQNVTKEAAFENKYGVDINRNEKGEVEVTKRPKDELEIIIKQAKKAEKDKKEKKKKKKKDEGPKLTKSQKWQLKKIEKKKKLKKGDEFENYTDHVEFGEIVHAPPTLVAPKKVEKLQNAPRPGRKELLLKALLNTNKKDKTPEKLEKPTSKSEIKLKKVTKTIDKKGKRKDLPNALRRQLENQQKEIVEAYKKLKSKKYT